MRSNDMWQWDWQYCTMDTSWHFRKNLVIKCEGRYKMLPSLFTIAGKPFLACDKGFVSLCMVSLKVQTWNIAVVYLGPFTGHWTVQKTQTSVLSSLLHCIVSSQCHVTKVCANKWWKHKVGMAEVNLVVFTIYLKKQEFDHWYTVYSVMADTGWTIFNVFVTMDLSYSSLDSPDMFVKLGLDVKNRSSVKSVIFLEFLQIWFLFVGIF